MHIWIITYKDGSQDTVSADGPRIDAEDYILVAGTANLAEFVWCAPRESVRNIKRVDAVAAD